MPTGLLAPSIDRTKDGAITVTLKYKQYVNNIDKMAGHFEK